MYSRLGVLFSKIYGALVILCLLYFAYAYLMIDWNNWTTFTIMMLPLFLIKLLPFGIDKALLSLAPLPVIYTLIVLITLIFMYYFGKIIEIIFKKSS